MVDLSPRHFCGWPWQSYVWQVLNSYFYVYLVLSYLAGINPVAEMFVIDSWLAGFLLQHRAWDC